MMKVFLNVLACLLLLNSISLSQTDNPEPLGISLENFDYPYEVKYFKLNIQNKDLDMAYMDVAPATAGPVEKVVTLFHGKNFFGEYWSETIRFLSMNGFRVIVPDQIGFGKSSKPDIHYSFHLLAKNTYDLLNSLGIRETVIVSHSMGGMLAARFALMYLEFVTKVIFENPIGLEDYKVKVPFSIIEELYRGELNNTLEKIRNYHRSYYVTWEDDYDKYVQVHYRWTLNPQYPSLAWVNALTSEMIYTQPVIYEFPNIRVPVLLIIGQEDRTAIGKDKVSAEIKATMGQYPQLGKNAAALIPGSRLVELENVGHIPHFEAAEIFHRGILNFLND